MIIKGRRDETTKLKTLLDSKKRRNVGSTNEIICPIKTYKTIINLDWMRLRNLSIKVYELIIFKY